MSVKVGLVGPKARPNGVADGQLVNILVLYKAVMADPLGKTPPINEFRAKL